MNKPASRSESAPARTKAAEETPAGAIRAGRLICDWRADLKASRNVKEREKAYFEFFLDWFERWRMGEGLTPCRESAVRFWRERVKGKEHPAWRLEQWGEAMRWYMRWLKYCQSSGAEVRSVPERMRAAVESAGARRGLLRLTRQAYGSWVARYGQWAGDAKRAMDPEVAREFLAHQVTVRKRGYETQKKALCALVCFFKDVCGMEEVDLRVQRRKSTPRVPVVLEMDEILKLVEKLTETWKPVALLQYAAGLRRSEVMSLRIKDIDLKRRTVTVRQGKGDKDRVTVFPEELVKPFEKRKAALREIYDADRAAGRNGVALPGALEETMSRAGEYWAW